jgi:hypothetical protein
MLMKDNGTITRFEMAPLLDVELSEEDDTRLEKYFNELDNWCYRNFVNINSQNPVTYHNRQEISKAEVTPTTASTPKAVNDSQMKDSPSSILIQRRYSMKIMNLKNLIIQTIETLDTFDNIQSRSSLNENDSNVLHVRQGYLTIATVS